MLSLIRRTHRQGADPAPSRWAWRMQRLMLTPGFRFALRAGVPFCLTLAFGFWYLSDEARRGAIEATVAEARNSIETRPEFMVNMMAIDGAEDDLAAYIRVAVPLDFPVSSFDLDLGAIRETITEMPPVRQAAIRIRPGGVLQVDITPREPVALWRTTAGLSLVDETGTFIAQATSRHARPDLPLIAGEGANGHVGEALELVRAAAPLGERMRGLVRMGARRWDVVLDREQRILLPEVGALQALERVIALENAQEVLSRDVARVDMRLAHRPTVKMNRDATEEWWQIRQLSGQLEDE